MRVLLISANPESIHMPVIPSGLACVAAATRAAGHTVEILDLFLAEDPNRAVAEALEDWRPQVIGMSVRNIDNQKMESTKFLLAQARDVAAACRRHSGAPIVLGGAGFSIFPRSVLAYLRADMGIQGEGEAAFPMLLDCLQRGDDPFRVPGLYLPGRLPVVPAGRASDLDRLPMPDAELWRCQAIAEDLWLPLQTRRGCALKCSYCSTPGIEGRRLRKRKPELVVKAIEGYLKEGFRRFYFTDNTFNLPPSYALKLCRSLAARSLNIRWRCILYPGRIHSELVRAMARAGCSEVSLGFESGNPAMLRSLNKKFTPEDVRRSARLLGDHGIRRTGFLLLGGPGETMESAEESLEFADSLELEMVKVTVGIRIYPGTPLAGTALQHGIISKRDDLMDPPRFYLARGLEDRLPEKVSSWLSTHPTWTS